MRCGRVVSDFTVLTVEDARIRYSLRKDSQDWKISWAQADVRSHTDQDRPDYDKHIAPILYRPFDRRFTFYTGESGGFICRPRSQVMRHMLAEPNVGLCVGRAGQGIGSTTWDICYVSTSLSDFNLFRRGGNCLFPLHTYPTREQREVGMDREPNLDEEFIDALSSAVGLEFVPYGPGDLEHPSDPRTRSITSTPCCTARNTAAAMRTS